MLLLQLYYQRVEFHLFFLYSFLKVLITHVLGTWLRFNLVDAVNTLQIDYLKQNYIPTGDIVIYPKYLKY